MEDKLQKIVNQYIDDTDQQLEVINIMTEEIKKTQKKNCKYAGRVNKFNLRRKRKRNKKSIRKN